MFGAPYPAIFNLSSGELLIVLIIIFLLFGAAKIPEVARSLGKARGEFEKGKREIEEEMKGAAVKRSSSADEQSARRAATELGIDIEGMSLTEIKRAIAEKLK
ncbi:MAG: twin-arginine translocase TatA/TatE family subunit [Euryarchaeota archaeon]|nr:twin-arginine translocase TatA/TatE family subunit [Euryarchaeota archaeon]